MDPLSLAANVAGLTSLTLEVSKFTASYIESVKNAPRESLQLAEELSALARALSDLDQFLVSQNHGSMRFGNTSALVTAATSCRDSLSMLHVTLTKLLDRTEGRKWYRRAIWPWKGPGHLKVVTALHRFTDIFHFSLSISGCTLLANTAEEISDIHNTQADTAGDIAKIRTLVEGLSNLSLGDWALQQQQQQQIAEIHAGQKKTHKLHILEWISTTDPSLSHNLALKKREPDTGTWFLESDEFSWWLDSAGFIWLYGIPGCGKTILCSTIIEATREICITTRNRVLAYFYFDFQRPDEHDTECLLGSVLRQTCANEAAIPKPAEAMYDKHKMAGHKPSSQELETFMDVVKSLNKDVYVINDALDEAPESNGKRSRVLKLLGRLAGSSFSNLHILVTSRNELDIRSKIGPLSHDGISIGDSVVDADIRKYVSSSIAEDDRMGKLAPDIKDLILSKLAEGAKGMFRWVFCQLEALRTCRRLGDIKRTLDTLPETLDETYERILQDMTPSDREAALSILIWMAYSLSPSPLTVEEIAEAAAIRPGPEPISPEDRLFDPSEIFRICRALVSESGYRDSEMRVVQFAHFSVQEYLLSGRSHLFSSWCPSMYTSPHGYIADCCMSSLGRLDLAISRPQALADNALIHYAHNYWGSHLGLVDGPLTLINTAVLLFDNQAACLHDHFGIFAKVLKIFFPFVYGIRLITETNIPLIHACYLGIGCVVRHLLHNGADVNKISKELGTALHGAVWSGQREVVEFLLKQGASVNVYHPEFSTPLGSAIQRTHVHGSNIDLVKLLLQYGADPNLQGSEHHRHYGCLVDAFHLEWHSDECVHLLLDHGADIHGLCPDHMGGSLFIAACTRNGIGVIKRLVEMGADPTWNPPACPRAGTPSNALYAAIQGGDLEVVEYILSQQAGVPKIAANRFEGAQFDSLLSSALRVAVVLGRREVVEYLLDRGAVDINQVGHADDQTTDSSWTLLQLAVREHEVDIAELLLNRGADANLTSRDWPPARTTRTPLQMASAKGFVSLVRLLLRHGADQHLVRVEWADSLSGDYSDYSDDEDDDDDLVMTSNDEDSSDIAESRHLNRDVVPRTALDFAEGRYPKVVEILVAAGARRGEELVADGEGKII